MRRRILFPALAVTAALAGSALVAAPAQAAASTVTLTGTISNSAGAPIATTVEWYVPKTGKGGVVRSKASGAYTLTVPASSAGSFYVAANLDAAALLEDADPTAPVVPGYAGTFVGGDDTTGYAWQALDAYAAPSSHTLDITLDRVSTIEAHHAALSDDDYVDATLYTADGAYVRSIDSIDTNDDSESFGFTRVVPGDYYVVAQKYGSGQSQPWVSDLVHLGAGVHTDLDIDFAPGATIEGDIAWGGKAVAGLPVVALDTSGNIVSAGYADQSGHYELSGLTGGDVKVETYPFESGFLDSLYLGFTPNAPVQTVAANVASRATLGRSASVTDVSPRAASSLRTASGKRLDPALATTLLASTQEAAGKRLAKAAQTVATTPAGGYQAAAVSTSGLGSDETREIDFALHVGGRVLLNPSGSGLDAMSLRVVIKSGSFYQVRMSSPYEQTDGSFGFDGLPSGTYQIYVAPMYSEANVYGTQRVTVTAGRVTRVSGLKVTHPGLKLHYAAGSVAANSSTLVFNNSTLTLGITQTDPTGRGDAVGLLPGIQRILFAPYGWLGSSEGLAYPTTTFSLSASGSKVLHPQATTGRVVARFTVAGVPVLDPEADIVGSHNEYSSVFSDDSSRIDAPLAPGENSMTIYAYDVPFQQNSPFSYAPVSVTGVVGGTTFLGTVALTTVGGSATR